VSLPLYIPESAEWMPDWPPAYGEAPEWFIAARPGGGTSVPTAKAGPDDVQCTSEADGLQCDRIEGHYDKYAHRASWGAHDAFTLIWGGAI
jgi:hypothetical protein